MMPARFARQPVTHTGPYCGPFALACVTDEPMEKFLPPKRHGMSSGTMLYFLSKHIGRISCLLLPGIPLWKALRANERCVLRISGHFIASDGFMVADTASKGAVWVHDHPHRRKLVLQKFIVNSDRDVSQAGAR